MEGELPKCLGAACPTSCCSYGTGEDFDNFRRSPRDTMLNLIEGLGVDVNFNGPSVRYTNCSTGADCKLLTLGKESNEDIRPLPCKVFPYILHPHKLKPTPSVGIYLSSCPATTPGPQVSDEFTTEVISLIKTEYKRAYGLDFEVHIMPQAA